MMKKATRGIVIESSENVTASVRRMDLSRFEPMAEASSLCSIAWSGVVM